MGYPGTILYNQTLEGWAEVEVWVHIQGKDMEFRGSYVKLTCCEAIGIVTGRIESIDAETRSIVLSDAARNGTGFEAPLVTISGSDVEDIDVVSKGLVGNECPESSVVTSSVESAGSSPVRHETGSKPVAVAAVKPFSSVIPTVVSRGVEPSGAAGTSFMQTTILRPRSMRPDDRETFGEQCGASVEDEFDIEGNLALFDKKAFAEQMRAAQPGLQSNGPKPVEKVSVSFSPPTLKLRFDEPVITPPPQFDNDDALPNLRAPRGTCIVIPPDLGTPSSWFSTDDGVQVPAVSSEVRDKLLAATVSAGTASVRIVEMVARSVADITFSLVDAVHRLAPYNAHQRPSVLVLADWQHMRGLYGVCAARHLANHGANVTVFTPGSSYTASAKKEANAGSSPDRKGGDKGQESRQSPQSAVEAGFEAEMNLFRRTDGRTCDSFRDLPEKYDLAVNCLSFLANRKHDWYQFVCSHVMSQRAPIIAVDPSPAAASLFSGTENAMVAKLSIGVGLPLEHDSSVYGQPYLCDAGVPRKVFHQFSIKYVSPFTNRFYVTLRPPAT